MRQEIERVVSTSTSTITGNENGSGKPLNNNKIPIKSSALSFCETVIMTECEQGSGLHAAKYKIL